MYRPRPIGVLDSGVGGMAVVAAIKALLPYESICYVGDTLHLPYGDKTAADIRGYVEKIGDFLLAQNCKMIVIGCVTATLAASSHLQHHVGAHVPVCNAIDPLLVPFQQQPLQQPWGLVATRYTIESKLYPQRFESAGIPITFRPLATPRLAPAIEKNENIAPLLQAYLSSDILAGIQGLFLGCTHYWLVKEQFSAYYQHQLPIISGAEWVAQQVASWLEEKKLLEPFPLTADHGKTMLYVTTPSAVEHLRGVADRISLTNYVVEACRLFGDS